MHWDGKMLPAITGHSQVERLPVMISAVEIEKLLGVPKCKDGTGKAIADAVYDQLVEWELLTKIQAMCFDTTATNTGSRKGACRIIQQKIGRDLLPLACRHHVFEIVLRAVFDLKMGTTKAPEVLIFNRFQTAWDQGQFDQKNFKSGLEDEFVRSKISDKVAKDVIDFCKIHLEKSQPRSDYKEFLQIAIIFLGGELPNFNVSRPGATTHARWMSKCIYALKIFVFRDQFTFEGDELKGIRDVCIFIVHLYLKVWFQSTDGIAAPNVDLNFIKDAISYAGIDERVSKAVLEKMSNHVWYLLEETIGFAFFDPTISIEEKRKMVENLKLPSRQSDREISLKAIRSFKSKNLSDFVTEATLRFFDRFSISTDFLSDDPSTWTTNEEYLDGSSFCRGLNVVNDLAERGVKLMTDFNNILTNDEETKQYLLQVVENYRREYPTFRKCDLLND